MPARRSSAEAAAQSAVVEAPASAPDPKHTGTFKKIAESGAPAFLHPCCICGNEVAPFGYGVRLRAAIDSGDPKLAGRWYCGLCRESAGDLK